MLLSPLASAATHWYGEGNRLLKIWFVMNSRSAAVIPSLPAVVLVGVTVSFALSGTMSLNKYVPAASVISRSETVPVRLTFTFGTGLVGTLQVWISPPIDRSSTVQLI